MRAVAVELFAMLSRANRSTSGRGRRPTRYENKNIASCPTVQLVALARQFPRRTVSEPVSKKCGFRLCGFHGARFQKQFLTNVGFGPAVSTSHGFRNRFRQMRFRPGGFHGAQFQKPFRKHVGSARRFPRRKVSETESRFWKVVLVACFVVAHIARSRN